MHEPPLPVPAEMRACWRRVTVSAAGRNESFSAGDVCRTCGVAHLYDKALDVPAHEVSLSLSLGHAVNTANQYGNTWMKSQ